MERFGERGHGGGGVDERDQVGLLDEDPIDGPMSVGQLLGELSGSGIMGLVSIEVGFDVSFVVFPFLRRENEGLAALREERLRPASEVGPVLFCAFCRFASICRWEDIGLLPVSE